MSIDEAIVSIEEIRKSIIDKKKKDKIDSDGDRAHILGLDVSLVYLKMLKDELLNPTLSYEQQYEIKMKFKDEYIEKYKVMQLISSTKIATIDYIRNKYNNISFEIENKITE